MSTLLIHNIGLLVTPRGKAALRGKAQGEVLALENAYILMEDSRIQELGRGSLPKADRYYDAKGALATPGLVDPHTHLVFGGWRDKELSLKLNNVPYLDILAAGGGILSTVKSTRSASEEALIQKTLPVLRGMLHKGVTTLEAKSGYGLNWQQEKKQLQVVQSLGQRQSIELVSTFMAAHALPPEYKQNRGEYIRLIIEDMLPKVAREHLASYCDVFCERGVFSPEESHDILCAAKALGLGIKCHSDEIDPVGGTEMAAALEAASCEHLIVCTHKGIQALKAGRTVACLLPATSFYLGAGFAPARAMIEAGVPVAFGSDFNPGSCPCDSLPLAMQIGCYRYRMTPEECLSAVTLNAAAAIGKASVLGSLEAGKQGDVVLWDAHSLSYLFYRFGHCPVTGVFKKGIQVV